MPATNRGRPRAFAVVACEAPPGEVAPAAYSAHSATFSLRADFAVRFGGAMLVRA